MIGLLQRVSSARVVVDGACIAEIATGLLVFVCAEPADDEATARRFVEKVLALRVFADEQGRMNRSVREVSGGVLLVPQFTLAADLSGGNRPSFSGAADPRDGRRLFELAARLLAALHPQVASGRFGATMQVSLTNDGPVTLWLRVPPRT